MNIANIIERLHTLHEFTIAEMLREFVAELSMTSTGVTIAEIDDAMCYDDVEIFAIAHDLREYRARLVRDGVHRDTVSMLSAAIAEINRRSICVVN